MPLKIAQLASAVNAKLEQFGKLTEDELVKAVKQIGEDTKKRLNNTSPKRTGRYAKDWAAGQKEIRKHRKSYIVYNKRHYQLTHLLEFGHATRNGGRTKEIPHIKPAEEKAIESLENKIKTAVKNAAQKVKK